MDEILKQFGCLAGFGGDVSKKTNFDGLYKNRGRLGNQEERRREILEIQRQRRNDKVDQRRGILDLVYSVEEERVSKSCNKVTYYRPSIYVAGFSKTSSSYKNVLMLSEWMVEKPNDFDTEWLVMPCPKGIRMLVVANRGVTKCFTKYGQFRMQHRTALPGGNLYEYTKKNYCSVLDCFFVEKISTMFVVDVLVWKDQPMTDGEAEFRHYWLQSQFAELNELKYINKKNNLLFSILPKVSCESQSFNKFMRHYPAFECNFPPLDGLMFYHRRAHYTSGETPLVGWLYPYMVPEVLGDCVTVHNSFLADKPLDYTNQADFIRKFEVKLSRKFRNRNDSVGSNMSVTDKSEEENVKEMDARGMELAYAIAFAETEPPSALTEEMEEEILLKDAMTAASCENYDP